MSYFFINKNVCINNNHSIYKKQHVFPNVTCEKIMKYSQKMIFNRARAVRVSKNRLVPKNPFIQVQATSAIPSIITFKRSGVYNMI